MDDVESVNISLCQPIHHLVIAVHHLVIIEVITSNGLQLWSYLFARYLVAAAIQCVQQGFRDIDARAKELHLLTNSHRRYAACGGAIIPKLWSHQVVALELNRTCVDAYF